MPHLIGERSECAPQLVVHRPQRRPHLHLQLLRQRHQVLSRHRLELTVSLGLGIELVMIPLNSGSGIAIAIWTKQPEPEWNQLIPKLNLTTERRDNSNYDAIDLFGA